MNKLFNILQEKTPYPKEKSNPPIWIMRQAGRYLAEYREIRSKIDSFLDLCYNPKLACEVTLQPIRRFDFDAAIIFSDILVIPDALGLDVKFVKGEGPKLQKIANNSDLKNLKISNIENHLNPVFENLTLVRSQLDKNKDLIGFSGSPWTLACYMIEGGSSKNFDLVKKAAISDEKFFKELIEILTQSIIIYLSKQIESGANIVKLFDSWAGVLPVAELQKWVIDPTKKIVDELKKLHPNIPIICFPRGIGANYENFASQINCDGLAIDQTLDLNWAKNNLYHKHNKVIQGNLDNILLAFGSKKAIESEVLKILEITKEIPSIFNLGHGILPQTPIENVELVLNLIRK